MQRELRFSEAAAGDEHAKTLGAGEDLPLSALQAEFSAGVPHDVLSASGLNTVTCLMTRAADVVAPVSRQPQRAFIQKVKAAKFSPDMAIEWRFLSACSRPSAAPFSSSSLNNF